MILGFLSQWQLAIAHVFHESHLIIKLIQSGVNEKISMK